MEEKLRSRLDRKLLCRRKSVGESSEVTGSNRKKSPSRSTPALASKFKGASKVVRATVIAYSASDKSKESIAASRAELDNVDSGKRPPTSPKDCIRKRFSLPGMNNDAEELIIEGFAIVGFLTKEDLDTFDKESRPVTERMKIHQLLKGAKKKKTSLKDSEMGESDNIAPEMPTKKKKCKKNRKDVSDRNNNQTTSNSTFQKDTEGKGKIASVAEPEFPVNKNKDDSSVSPSLSSSGLKREIADNRQLLDTNLPHSPLAQREDDDKQQPSPPSPDITRIVADDSTSLPLTKEQVNDDGASTKSASGVNLRRKSSNSPNSVQPAEAVALVKRSSTPSSSQEPNRAAADSSQKNLASSAAAPVITAASQPASESERPKEHHHKESRDRDRDRDREKRHHRDKEKDREKEQDKHLTPRPDSHVSATLKAEAHSTQKGFNPVVQSPNPLTPHIFHSPPTPLSPSFPTHPFGGGVNAGSSNNPFPGHPNFQPARWGMFSSAMMAPGAAGMAGHPLGMLGAGFDRPGGFFGFPSLPPLGHSGGSFPGSTASMGSHSFLGSAGAGASSFPGFPPSMSGLPMGQGFPGLSSPPTSVSLPALPSSSISAQKKTGKWCAMHVRIAWEIYNHQQRQQAQNQNTAEALKLGDFSSLALSGNKDLSMISKMGPPLSLGLGTPGLSSSLYSRPGAPSDLTSSLLQSSPRLPTQPLGWAIRPPYFPGMPSGAGMPGLGFPPNPLMNNRDMLGSSFSPSSFADSWRRPMAFGGLANASPTATNQSNGPPSASLERKSDSEKPEVKKSEHNESATSVKRSSDDVSGERESSSSKKKKIIEESTKRESPKENRTTPELKKPLELNMKKSRDRDNTDKEKIHEAGAPTTKAIDLRHRSESVGTNSSSDKIKSTSGAGMASSFAGDSPYPSFLSSQLDRTGLFGPSLPGFPPMWPSFDPLRTPASFNSSMDATREMLLQQWRLRSPMPTADLFRAMQNNPLVQSMERERLHEQLQRSRNFPPSSMYMPQMMNPYMRNMESAYTSMPEIRRSPTPVKNGKEHLSSTANGKESPTDLSQARQESKSRPDFPKSQSGKEASSSSSSSSSKSSSKGHHARHSPNESSQPKVEKDKS